MIFIIDDDEIMANCIGRACKTNFLTFSDGIAAIAAIADGEIPALIFLDILLDGPDGFTLLNELVSYEDTQKIPVVLISSLDFSKRDFSEYGVVGVLNKETMRPEEIRGYVEKCTK